MNGRNDITTPAGCAKDIVTVVVPVYNRASLALRTLDSIAAQQPCPRLIVVDNNSTDCTFEAVSRWAELRRSEEFPIEVTVETAKGAAAARQKGLTMVETPYVMFLDSDDEMLPGHIRRFVEAADSHPKADIIGWDIAVTEMDGNKNVYPFSANDIVFRQIFNSIFSTQRYAARTDFIRRAGGWNPEALGWDDYELGIRIVTANPEVIYLKGTPTVLMHRLAESITGTDYSSGAEKWEYAMELCRRTIIATGNRRWLRWLNLKLTVLAGLYGRECDFANAKRLFHQALDREPSALRRILLGAAFRYTSLGGRGIHHLLRPLI